ncbi:hypothetical protein T02_10590 [Trichinella nativa]|uniref:Uncharacterized protein n=1 Tax=Trichinella nativa TaxID=6335 RepID=A0A0V1KWI6_9BILA|nr:hypothetical protein T02_10590 [Trichinella nativa]
MNLISLTYSYEAYLRGLDTQYNVPQWLVLFWSSFRSRHRGMSGSSICLNMLLITVRLPIYLNVSIAVSHVSSAAPLSGLPHRQMDQCCCPCASYQPVSASCLQDVPKWHVKIQHKCVSQQSYMAYHRISICNRYGTNVLKAFQICNMTMQTATLPLTESNGNGKRISGKYKRKLSPRRCLRLRLRANKICILPQGYAKEQQSDHNCTIIRSSMLTFCGKQRHTGTSRKRLYVQVNALASWERTDSNSHLYVRRMHTNTGDARTRTPNEMCYNQFQLRGPSEEMSQFEDMRKSIAIMNKICTFYVPN